MAADLPDIVMDEGFIMSWVKSWERLIPEVAMLNFGPETLAWFQSRPQWDPRVRLATPAERPMVLERLRRQQVAAGHPFAGHPAASADPMMSASGFLKVALLVASRR